MSERIEIAVAESKQIDIWDKIAEYFKDKKIDILEIGVFEAGQIGQAHSKCNVKSYTGVDPYLGDSTDPYKGAYWKNEVEAFKIYEKSKKIFEELDGNLLKTTSEIYFRSIEKETKFDVIFVDGNHRFAYALKDMSYWFSCLAPGGVMIVDDYANTDTPDVTKAVNLFLEIHEESISSVDACDRWFKNKGKHIPVCNKVVLICKENEKSGKTFVMRVMSKQWYIWGTGNIAQKFWNRCGAKMKFSGVLDNYKKASEWNGVPLYMLSQISKEESIIIIATDIYYNEIKEQLIEAGFREWQDFIKYSVLEVFWMNNWYE